MAQLNTRGTLVRSRFDFYETSNAWGFVYGSVPSGPIFAYLLNDASQNLQLDIYRLDWWSSVSLPWDISVRSMISSIAPLTPTELEMHAVQPDRGAPVGEVGMATDLQPPIWYRILKQIPGATNGTIEIGSDTPFIVLPPLWSLAVSSTASSVCELAMTVWFQQVVDNVPPAP